ncbi:MAG: Crp/Fnr family transcriptional regulator [Suipraeoptans sp.]
MDNSSWKHLTNNATLKTYPQDTVIYRQSERPHFVFLVKSGRVVLDAYGLNGKKRSIYIADKGTCFGELSCLDESTNFCTATTNVKTELYLISQKNFIKEIHNNADFCMSLLKSFSIKTRLIAELLTQMSFDDSNSRVYHTLSSLIQQYGILITHGHYKLNIKFTHQEMAHLTGLSRVSVSNIFINLTKRGLIEKENGYLIIKDIHLLENYLINDI